MARLRKPPVRVMIRLALFPVIHLRHTDLRSACVSSKSATMQEINDHGSLLTVAPASQSSGSSTATSSRRFACASAGESLSEKHLRLKVSGPHQHPLANVSSRTSQRL